ncbi:prostate and testis expressed protein 3-like [Tiliqua scincoides]|uniref:prostate and testis expressed protein 3-like n=1 Tax=Tiliqua scincoides TaxID=71010 RepID=UPI00346220EF
MNKSLILCSSILLCCILAEALICHKCKKYKKGGGCTRGEGTCTPKSGQQCMIVTTSLNNIRGYYQQGCTKPIDECGTDKLSKTHGVLTTTCCDKDYCNKE